MRSRIALGWIRASVFTLAVAPAPCVEAQDLSNLTIEQLLDLNIASVSGASRFLQKVTEAPASVTVVTAEEIDRYGWRTLADVLRSVRGFYVTDDRMWGYVGTRGFLRPGDYNTRLLILVDGHRINDNLYDQALVQEDFPIDLTEIERIEVVRGPSSSLYGTSAFFGVVNIITAPVRPGERPQAVVEAGTLELGAAHLRAGRTFANGTAAALSAALERQGGDTHYYEAMFDAPGTNQGVAVDLDAVTRAHAFFKLDRGPFAFRSGFNARRKAYPTAPWGTAFNDRDSWVRDQRLFVDASWEGIVAAGWTARFKAAYDAYRYTGSYPYDVDADSGTTSEPSAEGGVGDWISAEALFSRTVRSRHRITGGFEERFNLRQRQFSYLDTPSEPTWEDSRQSTSTAFFAQDEFRVLPALLLNAGLRYDRYAEGDAAVKPRIAAIVEPRPRTALKAIYGTAFRAPNAFERFYQSGDLYKAHPHIQPESMQTLEGVAETYLGSSLRLTGSIFEYRVKHLIALRQDVDGLLFYDNVDESRATGVETEAEVNTGGVQARVSYTYTRARDNGASVRAVNSPAHLTQALLSGPLAGGVVGGLDLRALSSRRTRQGAVADAHVIPNVTFSRPFLGGRLHTTLVISNLFDAPVADPVDDGYVQDTIAQHGRTVRIRAHWRF